MAIGAEGKKEAFPQGTEGSSSSHEEALSPDNALSPVELGGDSF